jgi:hypothetical protein
MWADYQDLDTYGITINTFFVDRPTHRFNPTIYWNVSPFSVSSEKELMAGYPQQRWEPRW